MRRATPPEQVQTVPLTLHDEGQVGCTVECGHRKGTERGLLPTPSAFGVHRDVRAWYDGVHRFHDGGVPESDAFAKVDPRRVLIDFCSCYMFCGDDGREKERAGDEGEDDEQTHQHEEILQAGERCKEACGDARDRCNGGFKNGLPGFLDGRGHAVGRLAFFPDPMHDVDGIVHADAEDDGADHGGKDVHVHVAALHQQGLP